MAIVLDGTTGVTTPSLDAGNFVGQVGFFAMSTAPTGFLKANGAAISRTTYANLFSAIGTTFGAGDGSTTFNVPDLRGEFTRGWDDGRGVDSGRVFGSAQAATSHVRIVMASNGNYTGPINTTPLDVDSTSGTANRGFGGSPTTDSTQAVRYYTARPRNVALLACIKF